jgi:hypothetical protein
MLIVKNLLTSVFSLFTQGENKRERVAVNQNKRLLPTDIVLAAYLLAVGALQLVFYRHAYTSVPRAAAYLVAGALVLVVARLLPVWQHPLPMFLRTSYPLMATAGLFVQLNQLFFTVVPHYVDPFFVRLEEAVFGLQPAHALPAMFPSRWFTELMAGFYISYYVVIPALAFCCSSAGVRRSTAPCGASPSGSIFATSFT